MKIFVTHYSKLTNRKEHVLNEFKKHGIEDFEIIEKYDREDIIDDSNECRVFDQYYMTNKRGQVSLHLKHFYIYELMISENIEEALIFEDDIILSDDFMKKLTEYMSQTPENYDMLFIGNGCDLHIPSHEIVPNKNIYKKSVAITNESQGATRCTDSYVIHNRCVKKIFQYISSNKNKINLPIDWWLNLAARDLDLNVYWSEPTIVRQGSQNGLFSRSI
jgi:glycosyl transferase family 25